MAYRSAGGTWTSSSNTALSYAVPTGVQENDIVIAVVYSDNGGLSITAWPTGFTEIGSVAAHARRTQKLFLAWKLASASEGTTYSGGTKSSTVNTQSQAFAFSGRTTASPININQATDTSTLLSSPITIALTGGTASADDDAVWVGCLTPDTTGVVSGITPPTGYTERASLYTAFRGINVATKDALSGGATGSLDGTGTLASNQADYWGRVVTVYVSSTTSTPYISLTPQRLIRRTAR